MEDEFLRDLNATQLKAVTHAADASLQILAGPGSGKTRVLTSRIAHLILNCHLPPMSICAVTFTNKVANETKERLMKLIGKEKTAQLKMGTFHSLCARFLRKYPKQANVPDNFTVCDAAESKKIIGKLLKAHEGVLKERGLSLEPAGCASIISKAKSRGQSAKDCLTEAKAASGYRDPTTPPNLEVIVGLVYVGYEAELKRNNALDFDDLLIYGVKLFAGHKETVLWCRHILVDEFQDTNVTQYELMRAIGVSRCVTVVGDPDQSIYGWRSADVKNLEKMRRDFPNTSQFFLEESYRSTGAILRASHSIVSQDSKRIDKALFTSHPDGITPVLYQVHTEQEESAFIALEIKRLVAGMGGAFCWGDFAILLRYNALSRNLESALQKERIPCRVLGGHRYFERLEVKDLLAYLQLIDNPMYEPSFTRVINVPGRGIGEKTLNDILGRAGKTGKPFLELLEGIHDMKLPDHKPSIRKKIAPFVKVIRVMRTHASEGMGPSDLIRKLVDLLEYKEHLKKTQQDWETRWENVNELITFAKEVEEQLQMDKEHASLGLSPDDTNIDEDVSPLRQFLQVSMLTSEGDGQSEADNKDKVTISTCHSAKGLEWPVVIIPSVDSTTYPFIRSEDEDEERRLLYVACTRAKSLLYLTRSSSRMVAGDVKQKQLSKFIAATLEKSHKESSGPLFIQHLPHLEGEDRAIICKVLERTVPECATIEAAVEDFYKLGRTVPSNIVWRPAGAHLLAPVPSFPTPTRQFGAAYAGRTLPQTEVLISGFQLLSGNPITRDYNGPSTGFQRPRMTAESVSTMPHPMHLVQPNPSRFQVTTGAATGGQPKAISGANFANSSKILHSLTTEPADTGQKALPLASSSRPGPLKQGSLAYIQKNKSGAPTNTGKAKTGQLQPPPAPPLQVVSNKPLQQSTNSAPTSKIIISTASSSTQAGTTAPPMLAGMKRGRLGVGRATTGYTNKKFKPPLS
ncbi:P-loop containing nucleoside triphosphate hydrolase protein [Coprinopsis marcescibilis]|uniref:DNA 3'-5' helicase n=1 Tax=Coprinopsis marcescibilis TaxID=230819 RepID=A0A5C3KJA5_COPMA|nr:P-loop containing nucleoside triphosphate hydrolase protein [Coprinopsis marcescibilis]